MEHEKIVDGQEKDTSTKSDQAIEKMKSEAKDLGFKSPFDTETDSKATEKADEKVEKKEDAKVPTEEIPDDSNKTQKPSRAPLKEFKERIAKGIEDKLTERFGKEITELKTQLDEARKGKLDKAETSDLKESIKNLSKELNIDEEQLEKLTKLSRLGLEEKLTDMETRLKKYETTTESEDEEKIISEQKDIFKDEWNGIEDSVKGKYPNASREQLEKAYEAMEDLAHTEKYVNADLDYIMFKEAEQFEKILFSPRQRGFERQNTVSDDVEDGDTDIFNTSKPATYKDVEKMIKNTNKFEESQSDSRYSIK